MFRFTVSYKQHINISFTLMFRHIQWKYPSYFCIAKHVNAHVVIVFKLFNNVFVRSNWEFDAAPINLYSLVSNSAVIRSAWIAVGFNALVIHHLKLWSSLFFTFMTAFFLAIHLATVYLIYLQVVCKLLY